MILKPKVNARLRANARVSLLLVKNVTVMGNIGKTQGVTTAISPPKKANIKKPMSDF